MIGGCYTTGKCTVRGVDNIFAKLRGVMNSSSVGVVGNVGVLILMLVGRGKGLMAYIRGIVQMMATGTETKMMNNLYVLLD